MTSRSEYTTRVNRVMDHIQAHLAEDLSLETLAALAAFSPYHFHRIFKAMTGETIGEFVQRLRLEVAASNLVVRPGTDILTIALDSGFNSASAFARAFRERFGMSASRWRAGGHKEWRKIRQAERNPGQPDGSPCKDPPPADAHDGSQKEDVMDIHKDKITVETLPSYRLAYLRNVGPYGPGGGVTETWGRLRQWASARDLWTADRICIGIAYDDPGVTEPAKCRYDAGIAIPDGYQPGDQVNTTTLAGGKAAVAHFVGGAHEIARPFHALFHWLPESGYQPDDRPRFEIYRGEAIDEKTGIFTCDVCLPVKPL